MRFRIGLFLLASTALAAQASARNMPHVRTLDPRVRSAITEGVSRSALFRELMAQLNASDVIVYAETDCQMSGRLQGRLTFMSFAGGYRYVKVAITCVLGGSQQVAILAHELQHAREIAAARDVVDEASLAQEYRRIGFVSRGANHGASYDTHAAIQTGRRVWRELASLAAMNIPVRVAAGPPGGPAIAPSE